LLKLFAKKFEDSAELFDKSCADITGHVLEGLGKHGYTKENSKTVLKAVNYLKNGVKDFPAWIARWGVNYIYGTSAAVIGLVKVGEKPENEPYILEAIKWLKTC
jgi:squalene-hopene/tetraprenyl-beta-curcumene cyclase